MFFYGGEVDKICNPDVFIPEHIMCTSTMNGLCPYSEHGRKGAVSLRSAIKKLWVRMAYCAYSDGIAKDVVHEPHPYERVGFHGHSLSFLGYDVLSGQGPLRV
jgi:hypothetical protein